MKPDFWTKSHVLVVGAGSWGTVLANIAAENAERVTLWVREDERAREMNATRMNTKYVPGMQFREALRVVTGWDRAFEHEVHAVIWALPSSAARPVAQECAKFFRGDEILLHATKGVEPGSLKRVSTILGEELPIRRIGVISGPNLALEVAKGEPAATVVASGFSEVIVAGQRLLHTPGFRVYGTDDVIGVEWAGVLKNLLAIASGMIEGLGFGMNTRATLISRGLAEMVRFGTAMGGKQTTFLGLAGVGDLLATCSSSLSRNFRVGFGLAQGKPLEQILRDLGSTAEGVKTAKSVWEFAREHKIYMPITKTVYDIIHEGVGVKHGLMDLMGRNPMRE